jgi:hypothetical protein
LALHRQSFGLANYLWVPLPSQMQAFFHLSLGETLSNCWTIVIQIIRLPAALCEREKFYEKLADRFNILWE